MRYVLVKREVSVSHEKDRNVDGVCTVLYLCYTSLGWSLKSARRGGLGDWEVYEM